MRQIDIEVPRFARAKRNLGFVEKELDFRIGLNGDMKTKLSVFETQGVVSVFFNDGARSQAKQPDRQQWTLEAVHYLRKIGTQGVQIGVRPILGSRVRD